MRVLYGTVSAHPNIPFCLIPRFISPNNPSFSPILPRPSPRNQNPTLCLLRPTVPTSPVVFASASMASEPSADAQTKPYSVLFVCLGNICRSPAAEGVFTDAVKKRGLDSKFKIDSAGTINYHEVYR